MKTTVPPAISHQKEVRIFRCVPIAFTILAISGGLGAASAIGAPLQNLFVSSRYSQIFKYIPNGTQNTFASGLNIPFGVACDSVGNVYVTTWANGSGGSGSIYEFTQAGVQSTFASGLTEPASMAFDTSGDLFVSDYGDGYIYEFVNNQNGTFTQTTFASGLYNPSGLAFDSAGNLYVGTGGGYIYEYTSTGVKSTFSHISNQSENGTMFGLAFDSSGNLYAADTVNDAIYEISPGGTQSTFKSGLSLPDGLAFDSAGDLFEADRGSGTINEFANNNGTLSRTPTIFASGVGWINDLTFQPRGTWALAGQMNDARWDHTATLLASGQVLVAGGRGLYDDELASAELYNPATETWTLTGPMNTGRLLHTATLLQDGKVLVTGGYNYDLGTTLSTCELYDPSAGTWAPTGPMKLARDGQTATLLNNGEVLITGGQSVFGTPSATATCELYDPSSGQSAYTASMSTPRIEDTATLLPDGKVLVAGGTDGTSGNFITTSEVYDPTTGSWAAPVYMNIGHRNATATLLANGQVLVAGGYSSSGITSGAELYDPTTGHWTMTSAMNDGRLYHTAALLPDGQVLVAGGEDTATGGEFSSSAELYNPDPVPVGSWTVTGSMSYVRAFHTATLLNNGQVLVTGGGYGVYGATAELYY